MPVAAAEKERHSVREENTNSIPLFIPTEENLASCPVGTAGIMPFDEYSPVFQKVFGRRGPFHVYNPSPKFTNPPNSYIAVRVDAADPRNRTITTKTIFFKQVNEGLMPYTEMDFNLEDPSFKKIHGELVLSGVGVETDTNGITTGWHTEFYRGKDIPSLRLFFIGPSGMKDIRLSENDDGSLDVYTRPRDLDYKALGGEGQIGFRKFSSLDELAASPPDALNVENAPILSLELKDGEWVGVNEVHRVMEGKYEGWDFLLIHRAYKDAPGGRQRRHYAAGVLLHNTQTGEVVDLGKIATASDFPQASWKGMESEDYDLEDVFFATSISSITSPYPILMGGLADRNIAFKKILNPLLSAAT